MTTREEVYAAIDGEREYQERRWGPEDSEGKHSVAEFVLYMADYLTQARSELSRNADPKAGEMALHTMRKITTMGVACMEQNGVVEREGYES